MGAHQGGGPAWCVPGCRPPSPYPDLVLLLPGWLWSLLFPLFDILERREKGGHWAAPTPWGGGGGGGSPLSTRTRTRYCQRCVPLPGPHLRGLPSLGLSQLRFLRGAGACGVPGLRVLLGLQAAAAEAGREGQSGAARAPNPAPPHPGARASAQPRPHLRLDMVVGRAGGLASVGKGSAADTGDRRVSGGTVLAARPAAPPRPAPAATGCHVCGGAPGRARRPGHAPQSPARSPRGPRCGGPRSWQGRDVRPRSAGAPGCAGRIRSGTPGSARTPQPSPETPQPAARRPPPPRAREVPLTVPPRPPLSAGAGANTLYRPGGPAPRMRAGPQSSRARAPARRVRLAARSLAASLAGPLRAQPGPRPSTPPRRRQPGRPIGSAGAAPRAAGGR